MNKVQLNGLATTLSGIAIAIIAMDVETDAWRYVAEVIGVVVLSASM